MGTQDPLLGGITPDTTQQILAMVLAQLAAQKKQPDLVADYLAEMEEKKKKQEELDAQRAQSQLLLYPPNSGQSGGQNKSGLGNMMNVLGAANTASNAYNNESLWTNLGSLFSSV